LKELIKNKKLLLFIITLQEAFTAIIPFFLLTATVTLLYYFFDYFKINFWIFNINNLRSVTLTLQSFTSLTAVISIAYFFAIREKLSEIISILLALSVFITVIYIEELKTPITLPYGFTPATIFIPIISVYLLKFFYPRLSLNIKRDDGNYHIYKLFNYLFAFLVSYISAIVLYIATDFIMDSFIEKFNPLNIPLPDIIILSVRDFLVNLFWFMGIHGSHTVNAIFGKEILFKEMYPNFTYGEFNRLFVVIGGAGIGLGLFISLLILAKEKALKTITKISIPLVPFNINTLLIYAVVVFNRFFIIPFIFLPILNIYIAYFALKFIPVKFTDFYVVWNTPVFIDAYLKTNGNIYILALQFFLITIDTAVYFYFTKKFVNSIDLQSNFKILQHNLEIPTEIKSKQNINAFAAQKEVIQAQIELDKTIRRLNKNNLYIYYQPKVDIKNNSCYKFEALIRYNNKGKITGPTFLEIIEKAGLAPIIDIWVCKEVNRHIQKWKKESFLPEIGVNLHPDTLKSNDAIEKIISILKNQNITFEIIERSFLLKNAQNNLNKLKREGFKISIDDFGTGYSSMETITKHDIDELKLDKTLIDIIHLEKGYAVCKHIGELAKELNIKTVAEGVETKDQLQKVKTIGIDYVQGYIFSKALPFEQVYAFTKKFKKTD
jgi:EAL domain-containing protein (putative c-di-GMP-specific phosphodiesterase class I)/cellobiose-specific phosphotransferase system component IIC